MTNNEKHEVLARFLYPEFFDVVGNITPQSKVDIDLTGKSYAVFLHIWNKEFERLKFDSDWNALIPVLHKIMNMKPGKAESPQWYAYYSIETMIQGFHIKYLFNQAVVYITNKNYV